MAFRAPRWATFLVVPIVGGSVLWLATPARKKDAGLVTAVKYGDFRVVVTSAGELRAPRFVEIQGPSSGGGGSFGGSFSSDGSETFQTKISTLVPEGTVVKKGDFVAELDRAAIAPKLQDASVAVEKAEAQVTQIKLDTALALSDVRDQIHDLELGLEEKKLAKDQAVYEAPSVQRQAQLDLDKAERELAKLKANYGTKQQQAAARVDETAAEVGRQRAKVTAINALMEQFTVHAPADGMVIYKRGGNGRPRGVGATVSPFDPTIATLPDLRELESVTYINEIDIAKIAVGQPVQISLDGDPSKRLTGKVKSVANMGERRQNSDVKVFEVVITVDGADPALRPGMTTSNIIETTVIPNALSVPIEVVMSEGDIPYVYKRAGSRIVRQQIEIGITSENEIVVRRGIEKGDQVLFAEPPNGHGLPLARLR